MKEIKLSSSGVIAVPVISRQSENTGGIHAAPIDHAHISVEKGLIVKTLVALTVLVVIASSAIQIIHYATGRNYIVIHKMVSFLNVDLELNLPTFFSMLMLLFASVLLAVVTLIRHKQKSPYILHWAILSAGFGLMAFDEAFAFHERLIEPMRSLLGEQNLGILFFAWVVPAFFLIAVLALVFVKFGLSLPTKTQFWFAVSAMLFLGGAVGFELLEGVHAEVHGKDNFIYIAMATTEESLEMFGVIVFINTLLNYIATNCRSVVLQMKTFGGSKSLTHSTSDEF